MLYTSAPQSVTTIAQSLLVTPTYLLKHLTNLLEERVSLVQSRSANEVVRISLYGRSCIDHQFQVQAGNDQA